MKDLPDPRGARPAVRVAAPPAAFGIDTLISLAVGITVVACLYFASAVLIPITLAILLSFLVAPLVDALARLRLGHVASVFAAVLVSVSVIALLGTLIATQLTDLASGMPRYQATIQHKMDTVHSLTIGKLDRFAGAAGQALQRVTSEPPPEPPHSTGTTGGTHAPAAVPVEVREPLPTPFELTRRVLSPAISPLETAFIVFVVMIVILLQRDDLRDRAIRLFGSRDLHRTTTVMDETAGRLSRYFVSQLGVNAGVGVVIGAGLFLIGVPSPILWGILAALLRLVPYVGIWISATLATALAAAVSPGWAMAIWSLALFGVVEVLVGQVIEPLLYGHSTGLSPFSVVVAAIFWSWIWGPIGLILSTPLTLCLLVLGRHIRRLEFLDVLLGDQPALTPIENFYQRALAGDPDEAIEQAESLLRECSLCTYYDDVAIKGLRLAAHDVTRGGVTAAQLARIEATVNDLVDGLDSYADEEPPAPVVEPTWSSIAPTEPPSDARDATRDASESERRDDPTTTAAASLPQTAGVGVGVGVGVDVDTGAMQAVEPGKANRVLCIPGRGPLDPFAMTILQQLLGKHGFASRALPHEATSRTAIDSLDADDVGIVCIMALQVEGVPSHLRNLVRRLRVRLPNVVIVVGLWTAEDAQKWRADPQSAVGAVCYAASLRDVLAACHQVDATTKGEASLALIDA
ncbi:AI-2E family transporter [Paraburkholderia sp. D15]|uniref:AI-2E family transporter n=1 Tax=Paraburkholderia sp. D15 TaxID=2880218 RepID=UPI0024798E3F|nr:AI-2E family transporter [Paraburkholderia sp. D15]WGS53181.1 AI-2E family transporter [Paraburkholderia sp. D15]